METNERKAHWEKVFKEKKLTEVSWYQPLPKTSLELIRSAGLPKDAAIIDIGCGDSLLIDALLEEDYTNLYALDISSAALERAKSRLGSKADKVKWIVSDITDYEPSVSFDFWHDRAAFHFLTEQNDKEVYCHKAENAVRGYMSIGTFATTGPLKCSGLNIQQYSEASLSALFENSFEKIRCLEEIHDTPFNTSQVFTFCMFKKK